MTAIGNAASVARLVVTAGPGKGAERALGDPLVTIGRAAANAFALPDRSLSRRHARLEQRRGRWILFDEGSGNGTLVNGRRVRSRSLRHGDEIAMGDTRLRFLEAGGAIAWSDARPGRQRPALLVGAAGAALCLAVLDWGLRLERAREERRTERAAILRERARDETLRARALIEEGRPREAQDRLRVAAELDPAIARVLGEED